LIISHKHKFIFIKTIKTAGSSLDIALSKFCGSEDIITKLDREGEKMRRDQGYLGAQNFYIPKSRYSLRDWRKFLMKGKRPKYLNHSSAKHIRKYIGKKIWNSYYKFCVVRNPWDCFISYYYWRNKIEPRPSISEFLESDIPSRLQKLGIDLYTINGRVVVDQICFFENLTDDVEKGRLRCGLPEKLILPRAKGSVRKDRRSYREILNEEQAEKIRKLYSREIDLFGFEY